MPFASPTIRERYNAEPDYPDTTNDESNDRPRGHFGTRTLLVMNVNSCNSYPLDADVEDGELTRLYCPKGGCVDFVGCESIRYEERGPAVSAEAKKGRARKMIREMRTPGYRVELMSPAPTA